MDERSIIAPDSSFRIMAVMSRPSLSPVLIAGGLALPHALPAAITIEQPVTYATPETAPATLILESSPGALRASALSTQAVASGNDRLRYNAEDGFANLTLTGATTGGDFSTYSVVQGDVVAQGAAAYRLANPSFTDNAFTLADSVTVSADMSLWFFSRMGYAATGQFGRVQVSTNGGSNWTTIWSEAGPINPADYPGGIPSSALPDSWTEVQLSLAAYAGQTIQLRFLFDFTGGSSFSPGGNSLVGWFIDDIQVGVSREKDFYNFGDPTAAETLYLEFINRARADAAAEAQLLITGGGDPDVISSMNFFQVNKTLLVTQFGELPPTLPPLAFNVHLIDAARLHTQDMFNNKFQGHDSSSNPVSPNQPGDDLGDRVGHQGYSYTTVGENVFSYAENPWHGHAGFNIDWGNGPGGMQTPAGHRNSIHSPFFTEVGIGVVRGTNGSVGPELVTQDFGRPQNLQSLLTGVVYRDTNNNSFYDEGEGVGQARIEATDSAFYTISADAGAFTLPLGTRNATWTVVLTLENGTVYQQQVTTADSANVKLDWELNSLVSVQPPAESGVVVTIDSFSAAAGQFSLTYTVTNARAGDTVEVQAQAWGETSFTTLQSTVLQSGGTFNGNFSGTTTGSQAIRVVVR